MVEADSSGTHTRDPNRAVLRELASLLASEDWIDGISVFPATHPESIVITLEATHYPPDRVAEAYVEVQSYTNGDFHVSYVEDHHGTEWCCRWDRHRSTGRPAVCHEPDRQLGRHVHGPDPRSG